MGSVCGLVKEPESAMHLDGLPGAGQGSRLVLPWPASRAGSCSRTAGGSGSDHRCGTDGYSRPEEFSGGSQRCSVQTQQLHPANLLVERQGKCDTLQICR